MATLALSGTASAGTYLGLGIGTAPALTEDSDRIESESRSAKALIGHRFGQFSIEGALGGNSLVRSSDRGIVQPFGNMYHAAAALKFSLPLGNNFEAFGRGGLQHTWIKAEDSAFSVAGNGFLIGAGFEYRLNLGVGGGSIFIDYQINRSSLTSDTDNELAYDLTTRTWMLGLTLGI